MRKIYTLLLIIFPIISYAQFGNFKKQEELEKFKDTKLIVVFTADSAYNASLQAAMDKYWSFTGFEYDYDTAMKKYNKGNFSFLVFSKSKMSKKLKLKACSSEEDMNGLVIIKKYKRKILPDDVYAYAYCSNQIDTPDWQAELIRGVQLLNNYLNIAIQAKSSSEISPGHMMSNYPSDKGLLFDKTLYVEDKSLNITGKKDKADVLDGEIEEVDMEQIRKITINQENQLYYLAVMDEKYCSKMVLQGSNSELLYFDSTKAGDCRLTTRDLKNIKDLKSDYAKSMKK